MILIVAIVSILGTCSGTLNDFIFQGRHYNLCHDTYKATIPTKSLLKSIPINFMASFKLPIIANSIESLKNIMDFYLHHDEDQYNESFSEIHKQYGTIWPFVRFFSSDSVDISFGSIENIMYLNYLCKGKCASESNYIENPLSKQCECDKYLGYIENIDSKVCECDLESNFEEDITNPGSCICKQGYKFKEGSCIEVECSIYNEIFDPEINDCACDASKGYEPHSDMSHICVHPMCDYKPYYIFEDDNCNCMEGYEEVMDGETALCMPKCNINEIRNEDTLDCQCKDGFYLLEKKTCVESCDFNKQISTDHNTCECDESKNFYFNNTQNICECNSSLNFIYDESQMACTCNPSLHLIMIDGSCVESPCDDIGEVFDPISANCQCNEKLGFIPSHDSIQNCECSPIRIYDSLTASCLCPTNYITDGYTGCILPENCFLSRYSYRLSQNQDSLTCHCTFMTERSKRLDSSLDDSLCDRLSWRYLIAMVLINLTILNIIPIMILVKVIHSKYDFVEVEDMVAISYQSQEPEIYFDNKDYYEDSDQEEKRIKNLVSHEDYQHNIRR